MYNITNIRDMEPDKLECPKCGCSLSISVESPEEDTEDTDETMETSESEETYLEPVKKEKGFGSVFSKVMNSGK